MKSSFSRFLKTSFPFVIEHIKRKAKGNIFICTDEARKNKEIDELRKGFSFDDSLEETFITFEYMLNYEKWLSNNVVKNDASE